MAYGAGEGQPFERASKLGHLKIIEDPEVQRLLELFERVDDSDEPVNLPSLSGHVDFAPHPEVENVVAIDGSDKPIPNSIRAHKKLAFVSATEMLIRRREVEALRANPIVDPRDLARSLEGCVAHVPWALPLAGISMPGETVVASIRKSVDHALRYHRLYDTLQFLVSREWLRDYEMDAWMHCTRCGREFVLQRSARRFPCTHCGEVHSLADYLSIAQAPPEDWVKVEAAASLRSIFEMLLLFRHVVNYYRTPIVLQRTLFVKDGPLLLRAHLSRLVESMRAFLAYLHDDLGCGVNIVGVEKSGALVDHIPLLAPALQEPGDYFIPSVEYLHERVEGVPFVEATYRNRVQYGSKAVVRLGKDHVVALNIPTGEFRLAPTAAELYSFETIVSVLSGLLSYRYENALVPLVLVNSVASISDRPSGDILQAFAKRLVGDGRA